MCPKHLGTRAKFQLEILIRTTIFAIHKFCREYFGELAKRQSNTPPQVWVVIRNFTIVIPVLCASSCCIWSWYAGFKNLNYHYVQLHHMSAMASSASRLFLFNRLFRLITEKKTSRLHINGPLWENSTCDYWISLTKDQYCRKHLHIMGLLPDT